MPVHEIPRDDWVAFCESFSRQHQGWFVAIEVLDTRTGTRMTMGNTTLEDITASIKHGGEDEIAITLGRAPESQLTHTITAPLRIELAETEEGAAESLRIESANGLTTSIRFRSPVLPETVDGVLSDTVGHGKGRSYASK